MKLPPSIHRALTNRYLWAGLLGLAGVTGILYVVLDSLIMPTFTRHGASVQVPDVMSLSMTEADSLLERAGLQAEEIILRKPNLPKDVVIDQNPPPMAQVKPGRRIYLTINTGDTTTVVVPRVVSYGIRQARNMLMQANLTVGQVRPDSIPSVYEDIVTRQTPRAGSRVAPGTVVSLLYGTGLGQESVIVPDVTGMAPTEARQALLAVSLRSIVVDSPSEGERQPTVVTQAPAAGTSVREGYEIRLFLQKEEDRPE
ncbi:MAG: PASTA domain-containing protein [Bacteroidetes bacterium]|nr:PASTA domain-containing protein [Bacteroidota bacterium]